MNIIKKIWALLNILEYKIIEKIRLIVLLLQLCNGGNKIILLATPTHGNLGDHAIVYAEKRILKKIYSNKTIYEVPNDLYLKYTSLINKHINLTDIIIIDGGGNLGTIWKNEDDKISGIIAHFSNNKIIIFPQTCYYDDVSESLSRINHNRKIYSAANKLTVMLRDKASYQIFTELFPETKAFLVPDIVLTLRYKETINKRKGVLLCFRSDCEKINGNEKLVDRICIILKKRNYCIDFTTTYIDCNVRGRYRKSKLIEKLHEFSSAEMVVTDRLHAMIFCAVTGTPCLALDNISKKVSGGYEWIKELKYIYFIDPEKDVDIDAVITNILEANNKNKYKYPIKKICQIIKEENNVR